MVQRRQDLRFAAKPADPVGIAGDGVRKDLERNIASEAGIASPVDLPHSSGTECGEDLVRTESNPGGYAHATLIIGGSPGGSL
jgi:hypothetical protein